jgi:hypothetical protein
MLLGPISSGSPKGQGPFFSVLFILVGTWMLIRTWRDYQKQRVNRDLLSFAILGVSGLAALFIVLGIRGLIR